MPPNIQYTLTLLKNKFTHYIQIAFCPLWWFVSFTTSHLGSYFVWLVWHI